MVRTPETVRDALVPLPVRAGGLTLLPVTLGHWLVLDMLGLECEPAGLANDADVLRAGFVLSRPWHQTHRLMATPGGAGESVLTWARGLPDLDVGALRLLLIAHWRASWLPLAETRLAPELTKGEQLGTAELGNGLGGLLNVIADLAERYGQPDIERLLAMPVSTAMLLWTANAIRDGREWAEPSYLDRERFAQEDAEAQVKDKPNG